MGSMGKGWWRAALRGEPDGSWPGQVLSNGHATEGKVLLAWAFCVAYGKPLSWMMRQRGWSRSTFYRAVDTGSQRIADYLKSAGRGIALSRQPHIEGGALPAPSLAHQTTQIPEIHRLRNA